MDFGSGDEWRLVVGLVRRFVATEFILLDRDH